MSPRLDGAREASLSHWLAFTLFILQKSRMRRRARTDLCGGRSVMVLPTATLSRLDRLTDQAHIIETGDESYRFRRTLAKKGGKA